MVSNHSTTNQPLPGSRQPTQYERSQSKEQIRKQSGRTYSVGASSVQTGKQKIPKGVAESPTKEINKSVSEKDPSNYTKFQGVLNSTLGIKEETAPPIRFPNTVEAGGGGNCAAYSLLHQTSQINGENWKNIPNDEKALRLNQLRSLASTYMKNNSHALAQDEDFWEDLSSDWDTIVKEQLKQLLESINHEKLNSFKKSFKENISDKDARNILFAIADNWRSNMHILQNPQQELEAKALAIELYADYIGKPKVQLDSSFWNAYTKMANDKSFLQNHKNYPIKQILLLTKSKGAYRPVGLWPKHIGESNIDFSQCGFIYYNGKTHYQSFDRNAIVDYLTLSQERRPKEGLFS